MLRKRLWSNETFTPDHELMGMEHLEHCIDAIRQTLMCTADVTPLPWNWVEEDQEAKAVADVAHSCRDFERIRDWAIENQVKHFDRKIYVKDTLDE
jgi:Mycotoxin biosynthesis protein UstYa